ncbi:MAG TPA: BON domain-containing protein [Verrucomicrobiae bacterium]|nr:BON domain-containing protein [Verrucomicrobiae bacterium]
MKKIKLSALTILTAATISLPALSARADYTNSSSYAYGTNSATDADNSGRNVRDRHDKTLTPGDQGTTAADIQTTRNIRKALVAKSSGYWVTAKNIKIITVNGKVTLRGPVKSDSEKSGIVALANGIAGDGNVTDQLEVKTNP